MKRTHYFCIMLCLACTVSLEINAQSWVTGTNKIYISPDTTKVGIGITSPTERLHINKGALKIGNSSNSADRSINMLKIGDGSYVQIGEWEADDMLSFKANKYNFTNGNVGIGVSSPQYKLDVNGKLFLRLVDSENGWGRCYLQWQSHKLIMGVAQGIYSHTLVDIMPGGSNEGELFSQLSLYHSYSETNKAEKIRLCTHNHCWINSAHNVGIGTTNPLYKLDVRGTIRADEILVNLVNGADFVFERGYNLRPLSEVQSYIQANKHLPDIQSAKEMQQNGVNMNELQIQLLQKIEELTLYIIQQERRIEELEKQQCEQK